MKAKSLLVLAAIAVCTSSCATTTSKFEDSFALPSPKTIAYANDRHQSDNDNYAILTARNHDLWLVKLDGAPLEVETWSLLGGGWNKSQRTLRIAQYRLRLPPGAHTLTVDLSSSLRPGFFSSTSASSKYLLHVDFKAEKGHVYYLYANEVEDHATGKHTWSPEIKDSANEQ
jgi:hypothetical protein